MRKSQVWADIALVTTAVLIIGFYVVIAIMFLDQLDKARIASASADWRNTAILLANRVVFSPNCLGYIKSAAVYTNYSDDDNLVVTQINPPSTIDENKFDVNRLTNCLLMDSPEFRLYFNISVYNSTADDAPAIFNAENLDPLLYRNRRTLEEVVVPVKIIHSDKHFSYGFVKMELCVNIEYFEARLV